MGWPGEPTFAAFSGLVRKVPRPGRSTARHTDPRRGEKQRQKQAGQAWKVGEYALIISLYKNILICPHFVLTLSALCPQ
jgi:hypothetical protein